MYNSITSSLGRLLTQGPFNNQISARIIYIAQIREGCEARIYQLSGFLIRQLQAHTRTRHSLGRMEQREQRRPKFTYTRAVKVSVA